MKNLQNNFNKNRDVDLNLASHERMIDGRLVKNDREVVRNSQIDEMSEQYIDAIELLAIGIAHVQQGKFIYVNKHLCKMLGYTKDEMLELTIDKITYEEDRGLSERVRESYQKGEVESFKLEKRYVKKDNSCIWVALTIASKRDKSNTILYDVSLVENISSRKKAEDRVQYLASFDEMTNLPNRMYFNQLLVETIKYAKRYKRMFGIIFIDLDRFKSVNDFFGHAAGDQLLIEMAGRYKKRMRASDIVARLGGDEFVVIVREVEDKEVVNKIAEELLSISRQPFVIKGKRCNVTASIGVCMYPIGSEDVQTLMQNADEAMYAAKKKGKNNVKYYNENLQNEAQIRIEIQNKLQSALQNREFEVYFQPRISVKSGQINSAEALVRWNNPCLGQVSPALFIPIAEEIGVIERIGKWVLKETISQIKRCQEMNLDVVCISANISPQQFMDPDLITYILEQLAKFNVEPKFLELEITEGVVAQNPDLVIQKLNDLRAKGVRIAIDDFGTGYSSLSQLKNFPIDTLKIDRSFISGTPEDKKSNALTEAIVVMSKLLTLSVVAEGVETEDQYKYLKTIEVDEIQGFFFSKAVPSKAFQRLLKEGFVGAKS